jgi:hypothetical protein
LLKLKYVHHYFFSKISNKKNHDASYGPGNMVMLDLEDEDAAIHQNISQLQTFPDLRTGYILNTWL